MLSLFGITLTVVGGPHRLANRMQPQLQLPDGVLGYLNVGQLTSQTHKTKGTIKKPPSDLPRSEGRLPKQWDAIQTTIAQRFIY